MNVFTMLRLTKSSVYSSRSLVAERSSVGFELEQVLFRVDLVGAQLGVLEFNQAFETRVDGEHAAQLTEPAAGVHGGKLGKVFDDRGARPVVFTVELGVATGPITHRKLRGSEFVLANREYDGVLQHGLFHAARSEVQTRLLNRQRLGRRAHVNLARVE